MDITFHMHLLIVDYNNKPIFKISHQYLRRGDYTDILICAYICLSYVSRYEMQAPWSQGPDLLYQICIST